MRRSMRVLVVVALCSVVTAISGTPRLHADEEWTLLDQQYWFDEFSPLYTNGNGVLLEGDPLDPGVEWPVIVTHPDVDAETSELSWVQAVQNEAVIDFKPDTNATQIRQLLESLDLKIVSAWFEPDLSDFDSSVSWFHVRILPSSAYENDVAGLLEHLMTTGLVESAGHNDLIPLCTALFPNGPNDNFVASPPSGTDANRSHLVREKLDAAWKNTNVTFGTQRSCVVVMDTGIDAEHPDFTTAPTAGVQPSITRIYRPLNGIREGIQVMTGGQIKVGQLRPYEVVAPLAAGIDGLKGLSIDKLGHGHGTAMAGYIAAETNNTIGVAAGPGLMLLSARMRMPADNSVEFASVPKILKKLKQHFGQGSKDTLNPPANRNVADVRVVYMGFASPNFNTFKNLIKKMRRDLKSGNDRVYVAPAGNDHSPKPGFPAAILNRVPVGQRLAVEPEILGVTASEVNLDNSDGIDRLTNFINESDQTFPVLDHTIYDVSAFANTNVPTTDANDVWYKTNNFAGVNQRVGYRMIADQMAGPTLGFDEYVEAPSTQIGGPPGGTSTAAAHVASLAGLLWARFPSGQLIQGQTATATKIGSHIRRFTRKSNTQVPDPFNSSSYTVNSQTFWRIDNVLQTPTITQRIPDMIDFEKALLQSALDN